MPCRAIKIMVLARFEGSIQKTFLISPYARIIYRLCGKVSLVISKGTNTNKNAMLQLNPCKMTPS